MPKLTKDEALQWYAQNREVYKKLSTKINTILIELLEEASINVHAITNRTKNIESFATKIEDSKYDDPINQITDFSGVRIIAYVEDDLKPICQILEETFYIDPDNSLDKSEELGIDKVGYRSIHYIARIKEDRLGLTEYRKFKDLKFEIQVRTILQHAWAEIQHDRNYKFNGVLPDEIKRRFGILSGTLELIDREFNQLSREIDKVSEEVKIATNQNNNLDEIEISSTSLKEFLINQFKQLIESGILVSGMYGKDYGISEELKNYQIQNLKQLQSIIPKDFQEKIKEYFTRSTFIGILRDIMIINDPNRYFTNSYNNNWNGLDDESIKLYESYGINTRELSNRYGITMHEN